MLAQQQLKQLFKQNIFVLFAFKKGIRPIRTMASIADVQMHKKFIIIKYRVYGLIPRFKKFSYNNIESIKPILKRKKIILEDQFQKMTKKGTTIERKKEARKVFLIKASLSIGLIVIAAIISIVVALFIN